jgi:hypothetical protein
MVAFCPETRTAFVGSIEELTYFRRIESMESMSNVGIERVQASEKTFRGLRRFNLVMGFLHLLQGI